MRQLLPGARARRRSIRLRLTLLLGALFVVGGAALLATTYLLVQRATGEPTVVGTQTTSPPPPDSPEGIDSGRRLPRPAELPAPEQDSQAQQAAEEAHEATMHQLLVRGALALGFLALAAVAGGWLVAGRMLVPLRRITETTRDITQHDLDRRLALPGPADELKDLADTIDGLLARLEAAFESQRRFVANVSHELRTPLAMMRTSLDVAATKPGPAPPALHDLDAKLREGLDRADRLIASFLTLAQAQQGDVPDRTVALNEIVTTVLRERAGVPAGKAIDWRLSVDPADVRGSEVLLSRLVENLVDNAVRHNRPDGWVDVVVEHDEVSVRLSVVNGGARIEPADAAELVEPFRRRAGDRAGRSTGFGLGLSIVAAITSAHGGTLAVEPGPVEGLKVVVVLPAAEAAPRTVVAS